MQKLKMQIYLKIKLLRNLLCKFFCKDRFTRIFLLKLIKNNFPSKHVYLRKLIKN